MNNFFMSVGLAGVALAVAGCVVVNENGASPTNDAVTRVVIPVEAPLCVSQEPAPQEAEVVKASVIVVESVADERVDILKDMKKPCSAVADDAGDFKNGIRPDNAK